MFHLIVNGLILGFVSSPTCPSNAEEIRWGARSGFGPALAVGLGAVAGDAIVLAVVLLGLYPLMQAFPFLNSLLWLVGALVLAFVAFGLIKEASSGGPWLPRAAGGDARARPFLTGLAITAFNPFTVIWWVGLLGASALGAFGLSLLFPAAVLVGSLLWFAGLAALLHFGRGLLTGGAYRWILILSSLVLFAYAGWLAWRGLASL
jgi:L-lysine exporter family protein LysE/ArgO